MFNDGNSLVDMKDDVDAALAEKYNHLPLPLHRYLLEKLQIYFGKCDQNILSIEMVKSIFKYVDIAYEAGDHFDKYLLIKCNVTSSNPISIPAWKIVYRRIEDLDKEGRFDEILEWIIATHQNFSTKNNHQEVFSRCREERVLFSEVNKKTIALPIRNIVYLSAEGDFTNVYNNHRKEHKAILVDMNIGRAEAVLSPFFFDRIHRSYMVNLGCIREIYTINSLHKVVLCSGVVLPVARRRYRNLKEKFDSIATVSSSWAFNDV